MNSSVPEALVVALISFISGFATGQLVRFRRTSDHGRKILHPELSCKLGNVPWLKVVLIVLFLVSTTFLVQFTYTQRGCNEEFRRTITERASASVRENAARQEADQALYDWINGLLTTPQSDPRASEIRRQLTVDYLEARGRALLEYKASIKTRTENPYPQC